MGTKEEFLKWIPGEENERDIKFEATYRNH